MSNNKYILFLGIPGSGKGTQSGILKAFNNFCLLGTGEIIRNAIVSNSFGDLSKKIAEIVSEGKLIPDDLVMEIVFKKFEELDSSAKCLNIVLDGIPRNLFQAESLELYLKNHYQKNIDLVILLDLKKRLAVKRLMSRMVCPKCGSIFTLKTKDDSSICPVCLVKLVRRADDNMKTIKKRLLNDRKAIDVLLNFYHNREIKCVKLDADSNANTLHKKIKNIIDLL